MKKEHAKETLLYLLLGFGLVASFVLSLSIGDMKIPLADTLRQILAGKISNASVILWEIRLPRALLAILVGGSLGLAGAAMQGLLRNPLAEPGILGVTGGGALGAVLVFYSGWAAAFPFALPLGGMAGAFLSVLVLYLLAGYMTSVQTLILAGVALNTLAFAGTSLALNLSSNPYASLEIVFWQMGSLTDRSFHHLFLILPFVAAGLALLVWNSRALDALSLGEQTASSLGISLPSVRLRLIVGTALAVGASVAVCGSIAFVGLVVPHLLRPFVRYEPGRLLGVSALGGATLLLLADVCVKAIPTMVELKLGVLTALIGAPFFVVLILKMKKELS